MNKDISIPLWNKVSKKGNNYSYGRLNYNGKFYQFTLLKNENKKNEKCPDYTLLIK